MAYLEVGDDLGALAAVQFTSGKVLQAQQLRKAIPEGSIVPLVRKLRKPSPRRVSTPEQIARYVAKRRQSVAIGQQLVRAMPKAAVTKVAAQLRGLLPPGASISLGEYGFGAVPEPGDSESMSDLANQAIQFFQSMRDQINQEFPAERTREMINIGHDSGTFRMGETSAGLGIDVGVEDAAASTWRYFAQVNRAAYEMHSVDAFGSTEFENVAAVFSSENVSGGAFTQMRSVFQSLESEYGGVLSPYNGFSLDAFQDAIACGEGGLRNLAVSLVGQSGTEALGSWLNAESVSALASSVTAWIGAAESGRASGYLRAGGTTLQALGGSIPAPAGTVVAAAGTAVSLVSGLMDRFNPEEVLNDAGELQACEALYAGLPWAIHPEAWWAMAICFCVEEGNGDPYQSPTYKDRSGADTGERVLAELRDRGWVAKIDKYTGEVMVARGPRDGGTSGVFQRLLDAFPGIRAALIPIDDPMRVVRWLWGHNSSIQGDFDGARACGMAVRYGVANGLYCIPSRMETLARFPGAEASDPTYAFRFKTTTGAGGAPPQHIPDFKETLTESWNFWATYTAAMVASIFLGGTVPYGVARNPRDRLGYYVSTGVGGYGKQQPFGVFLTEFSELRHPEKGIGPNDPFISGGYPIPWSQGVSCTKNQPGYNNKVLGFGGCCGSVGVRFPTIKPIGDKTAPVFSFDTLARLVSVTETNAEMRMLFRVPNPTPKSMTAPETAVKIPFPIQTQFRLMVPSLDLVAMKLSLSASRAKSGLFGSIPTWQVLAGLGLLGGVAYALTKKRS